MKKNKKRKAGGNPKPTDIIGPNDRLDWVNYNLLELLFLFCKKDSRSCKPESHRAFAINKPEGDIEKSFCVLLQPDRQEPKNDHLIKEGSRPDYLVIYKSKDRCLVSIIEMKGMGMESGVKQVVALHEELKKQFSEHLPRSWKPKFQAIVLGAPNAQIPEKRLLEEKRKGLHIFPLCYPKRFELFPYISVDMTENPNSFRNYVHPKMIASDEQFTELEKIFTFGASRMIVQDEYCRDNYSNAKERVGMYLRYYIESSNDHVIFHVSPKGLVLISSEDCRSIIEGELSSIGVEGWRFEKNIKSNDLD